MAKNVKKNVSVVTMTINEKLNGVELKFNEKPSEEIRAGLKSAGFRWHNKKQIWYAKQNDDTMAIATALSRVEVKSETKGKTKKSETKGKTKKSETKKSETKVVIEQKPIAYKGNGRITAKLIKALNETEGLKAEKDRDWLWVSGETRQYKDALKALGFRFSGKRQAWYLA